MHLQVVITTDMAADASPHLFPVSYPGFPDMVAPGQVGVKQMPACPPFFLSLVVPACVVLVSLPACLPARLLACLPARPPARLHGR